jgi:uncharacterized cupredoxin-like copper-binding protein
MRRSLLRTLVLPTLAVAAVAAALAAPSLASRTHATAGVAVAASEFKFKLTPATVAHGTITFTVTNKGHIPHDFKIGGKKTALISPGKSAKLTVTLKKGKYPYLCTVPGHSASGMKGTLTVS